MSYAVQPNIAMLSQPGSWNTQAAPVAPQPMILTNQGQVMQPQLMPATGMMNPVYAQPGQGQQLRYPPAAVAPWGMQQPVYVNSMSQIPQGAIPVSQEMLAQALGQGQAGAQGVQQPEGTSPIKSALKFAGIGAAAGAAFGIIPFLPLGLFSGALVGAAAGAALGLVKGMKAKKAEGEFHTMEQQQAQAAAMAQAGMVASTPPGARSVSPAEAQPVKALHMSPATRKKWAAKVAAEKAAAAAAKKH